MKINREHLIRALDSVSPGLSNREIVQQSSCVIFKDDKIMTFNDECAATVAFDIGGIEAAVIAKPLIELLNKMQEDVVDIEITEGKNGCQFAVKGKRRRACIRMEQKIELPIDAVDRPEEWAALDSDFDEAVGIVKRCAGKDGSNFVLTCVNIAAGWVEACDNFQAVRYPMNTGIDEACQVRGEVLRHVTGLGMVEIGTTENWLHFRNAEGLVLSCRKYQDEYNDLGRVLDVEDGDKVTLPGGLAEAIEKAEIFSNDGTDDNKVTVDLKPGGLMLKGEGANGKYEERKKVSYDGKPLLFSINPELLLDITTRTNDCVLSDTRLMIDCGKSKYVACLGKVKE